MFETSSLPVEWRLAPLPVVLDIPLRFKTGQLLRQGEIALASLSFASSDVIRADEQVLTCLLVFSPVDVIMTYFVLRARSVELRAVHAIIAGAVLSARFIDIVDWISSPDTEVTRPVWKAPAAVEAILPEELLLLTKLNCELLKVFQIKMILRGKDSIFILTR